MSHKQITQDERYLIHYHLRQGLCPARIARMLHRHRATISREVRRRTGSTFQELAKQIDDFLRAQMPVWRGRYPGVENLKVAVMGCIVNGPGESKHADIGISLPGNGEAPAAPVFIDGQKALTLRGDGIAREFQTLVEQYIERRFGASS